MAIELSNIKIKSNGAFQNICPYGVGAIYMSVNATSPASLFGGTWERVRGRYLFPTASDSTSVGGITGGSWTQTLQHWHTAGDMVARFDPMYLSGGTNYMVWKRKASPTGGNWYYTSYNTISSGYNEYQGSWSFGDNGGICVDGGTGDSSPVVDFNNIPFFLVYCWYRKA